MPKHATGQLGDRTFTIIEKPTGQQMIWRKRLRESSVMGVFESLDGLVADLVAMVASIPEGGTLADIDLAKALGVARVLPTMVKALSNSVDDVIALLYAYDSKLAAQRKWIEANAYDEELILLFLEVLKIAFPITALWGLVRGSRVLPTSGNSPAENGELNGLPISGPKKKALTSS